jgi:hypothetical protein
LRRLVPGLAIMSVVALVAGAALERRELEFGVPELRWSTRGRAGVFLSSVYSVAVLGAVVILSIVVSQPDFTTPMASPALVKPLGPGLAVTPQDPDCGTSDQVPCTEEFQVRSMSGLRGEALLSRSITS